jgi:glycosyltransferase involved in cell wall biosynthesis
MVTVIVPTHDHASTLDFAVGSVLTQTVTDLDVVVVGDGVGDDTREVVRELSSDGRIRFLDVPKSPSRAEEIRHRVLTESRARYVCYLGDDDLMLPDHVETMVDLLSDADFAHPSPLMIRADGQLWPHPIDLQRPECIAWQLQPQRNAISLTGVAHRVEAYKRLPFGWRAAPAGRYSDHFMWEQWFRNSSIRFVTGDRLTVLKLDSSDRKTMTPEQRRREIAEWKARADDPTFSAQLTVMVTDAWRRWAVQARLDLAAHEANSSAFETLLEQQQVTCPQVPELGEQGSGRGHERVDAQRRVTPSDDPGFGEPIRPNVIDRGDETSRASVSIAPVPTARASVILPVHNMSRHLSEAVDSVIGQVRPPDELIVVNDGSTDVRLHFLHDISAPFPIRVVHQANLGQSAARNFGAQAAGGELLAFLDQDDVWHPHHLAVLCRPLLTDRVTAWSYSDFDEIDADGHMVTRSFLRDHSIEHPKMSLSACLGRDLMVVPSASVIRRDAFDLLGGFDQTLCGYEDDDLYVRAFRSGCRFVFQPESLTSFRVHRGSASASPRFLEGRMRFSAKLEETIEDDRRSNRFYMRDVVAPRFFDTSLDDYVRAVSERDWVTAKGALIALRHFASRRRHKARFKLAFVRSPRLFWWMLRVNDSLPRRLRVSKNPIVHL